MPPETIEEVFTADNGIFKTEEAAADGKEAAQSGAPEAKEPDAAPEAKGSEAQGHEPPPAPEDLELDIPGVGKLKASEVRSRLDRLTALSQNADKYGEIDAALEEINE